MEIFDIPIDINKKDARLHGSYEFPIAIYCTKFNDLLHGSINWHWHDEMHFYVVKDGRVAFYVNSAVYELEAGEGVFINCGCIHMLKPVSPGDNSIITLFVHPKLFSCFPGSLIERKYVTPYMKSEKMASVTLQEREPWQGSVLRGLEKIYETHAWRLYGYELDIAIEWLKLWRVMISNISLDVEAKVDDDAPVETYRKMKTILMYINEHYAEKITLKDIADRVNLSRNECCRFFKRHANCTLFQYIIDYRLSKASEFLRQGGIAMKEVAYISGFEDASYFTTCFKKKTGYTPKEYRSKMKHDGEP